MKDYQLPINETFEIGNLITELIEPLFIFKTENQTISNYTKNQIPLFDI